jgi:anti-anti-sigma factor
VDPGTTKRVKAVEEHASGTGSSSQTIDGVYVLAVEGEFDYVAAPRIRMELEAARKAGAEAVVFDMRLVSFLDSAGLRVVVDAVRQLDPARVALAGADELVLRVLSTTGLDQRLQVCATVDQAVDRIRP